MKKSDNLFRFIGGNRTFIRSVYAETLLEDFFVAAIASVLGIRLLLHFFGYPSLIAGGLHVAHVLYGGIGMLLAMVFLLAFLDHGTKELAAVIGGMGFGAFIDELGKFVTQDNDYFFKPTVALIYVTFVLLFLLIRAMVRRRLFSNEESLANAFEIAKEASITGLDEEQQRLALRLLEEAEEKGPAADNIRAFLLGIAPLRPGGSPLITRLRRAVDRFYEYVATKWWFTGAVIGFFALVSVTSLYSAVALVEWSWALILWVATGTSLLAALFWPRRFHGQPRNVLVSVGVVIVSILISLAILSNLKQEPLTPVDWAQFVFPAISSVFVVAGLLLIPRSRLQAYWMFRRAILASIFLTQALAFYQYQFLALLGLLANIAILVALRYMIDHEQMKLREYNGGRREAVTATDSHWAVPDDDSQRDLRNVARK